MIEEDDIDPQRNDAVGNVPCSCTDERQVEHVADDFEIEKTDESQAGRQFDPEIA